MSNYRILRPVLHVAAAANSPAGFIQRGENAVTGDTPGLAAPYVYEVAAQYLGRTDEKSLLSYHKPWIHASMGEARVH
jgi:hypothetical protein